MKPDMIGRAVGAVSLTLGITDMILGRTFARGVGVAGEKGTWLFRVAAAREIATGVAGLIAPASAAPLRWRLAGDAFDLAALGSIAARDNPRRKMALFGLGLVVAVTIMDVLVQRRLANRRME